MASVRAAPLELRSNAVPFCYRHAAPLVLRPGGLRAVGVRQQLMTTRHLDSTKFGNHFPANGLLVKNTNL